ncbi:hypothetical protein [Luteibacter aegosomatissinici]|uniref:hypothetical protein n=1 Tax=Luteibacter aegosomatissinici TaxID=2911539 RepID=UPI001FF8D9CA|nr:hypothetical protein [Luteibacter aegosomatissinici]UPG94636.1 hypothetical protein L2Y97_00600 [Luteibacter aegosomatissinici]
MNRFLDRIADLYAPVGQRGLFMDGQYRFAADQPRGKASPAARKPAEERPATWRPGRYLAVK